MKKCLLALLLCLLPTLASAQTVYTTASKFTWTSVPNAMDAADAQQMPYRLYVDGTAYGDLTGVTCAPPVPPATLPGCQANLTPALVIIANRRKVSFTLTARDPDAGSIETVPSVPFVEKKNPNGPPSNLAAKP